MPNPPKPAEVKRRAGNPGKRALPKLSAVAVLPAADGVPDPLRPLGVEGGRMWARIWSAGAVWLSATTDVDLVQIACEAMDERIALRDYVLSGQGEWRDRIQLRNLDDQIKGALSALGFTPVDRTRMGVAEVRKMSKLEELRARQAK